GLDGDGVTAADGDPADPDRWGEAPPGLVQLGPRLAGGAGDQRRSLLGGPGTFPVPVYHRAAPRAMGEGPRRGRIRKGAKGQGRGPKPKENRYTSRRGNRR